MMARKRLRQRAHPGGVVAEAKVAHLALADQLLHAAHKFFNRSEAIPKVAPQEVDVIGSQPPQRVLHSVHHALATAATAVWVPWPHVSTKLGGNHHAITGASPGTGPEVVPNHLLAVSLGVDIGGIDVRLLLQSPILFQTSWRQGRLGERANRCDQE